jgi:hypothetical protein
MICILNWVKAIAGICPPVKQELQSLVSPQLSKIAHLANTDFKGSLHVSTVQLVTIVQRLIKDQFHVHQERTRLLQEQTFSVILVHQYS